MPRILFLRKRVASSAARAVVSTRTALKVWMTEEIGSRLPAASVYSRWPECRRRQVGSYPLRWLPERWSAARCAAFGKSPFQVVSGRTAGMAVRRLVEEAGGFAIANLLRDLGDGVDFDAAFAHRIQRTFADFQASLAAK